MNSLFIVNDFPPIIGGQSSYLYNLCRTMPKDKLIVLAPKGEGDKDFDRKQPFKIVRKKYLFSIPLIEKICKIILPLFYCLPILKKEKIRYVHCAHVLSTGFIGWILHKLYKYPYLIYTHSSDIMEYQKYPLIKYFLKMILKNAFRVFCNSEFTRAKLYALDVPDDKIIKVCPHIDYHYFSKAVDSAELMNQYGLENKKIILSINRLVQRKGNDRVIQVLAKIKKSIPNVVYIIGGDGPYKDTLQNMVQKNHLENDVIFVGRLKDDDIIKFYHCCDLLIMASRELKEQGDAEGFGVVFLEANAAGKPVIGGDSGGVRDAVVHNHTGLLVDPNNDDEITEAILQVLNDPDYAKTLGLNGKKRVKEEFNSNNPIREIDFLFK